MVTPMKMKITFFWILILVTLLTDQLRAHPNDCKAERCKREGPPIRYPFRRKGYQSDHCGYPGFELSCSSGNDTVLQLPTQEKLQVKSINYKSRVMEVHYDPNNCHLDFFWKNRNLSNSPFSFSKENSINVVLFNCSALERKGMYPRYQISCLSDSGYQIYAIDSDYYIDDLPLVGCKKMYSISDVPFDIYNQEQFVQLKWSKPNCTHCEAVGKRCVLKNGTKTEIECFNPGHRGEVKKFVDTGASLGGYLLIILALIAYRAYHSRKIDKQNQLRIEKFLEDYKALKPSRYSYVDIKRITTEFKDKLGQGAYGTVFKGKLSNELFVTVKILNSSKGNGEDFINEVGIMGRIHHINVVRLVGYCADGFRRALIYEFLPNGSLQQYISSPDSKDFLGWQKLQDIILGIAKGIEYIHQGCEQRILHFDIKPHNVLLDQNFTPKISDFGLSKLCSKDQSTVSMTMARGTMGYIAPEVFSRNFGHVSYKSDVYSFGMLLLEMVGGRKNIDITDDNISHIYYPEWIYSLLDGGEDLRIHIEEEGDAKIARKLAIVGLWCIQWHPIDRPSMKTVVQMLEEREDLIMPPNPFACTGSTKANPNLPARRMNIELEAIAEVE